MRIQLNDVTFLFLIRLDSLDRLENFLSTVNSVDKYFNTNIYVLESDSYDKGILRQLLKKSIFYSFVEDSDPVLYKTKYFNIMIKNVKTKYVSIVDSDIVIDHKAIMKSIVKLRNNDADVSYPYNGVCRNIKDGLKVLFFKRKTPSVLYKNIAKTELLYKYNLVGGIVIINTEKYIQSGIENENYYGWGNEDFDRYWRFKMNGYKIYRVDNCLFHLDHPRLQNSKYSSYNQKAISDKEIAKIISEYRKMKFADLI